MKFLKSWIKKTFFLIGIEQRQVAFPIFRKNFYSQNGEDGVIEFILKKLPGLPSYLIDIGANDGIESSNSRHLIEHHGFVGLLIEPFPPVFQKLQTLYQNQERILLVNKAVGSRSSEQSTITWHGHVEKLPMPVVEINSLFEELSVPREIGLLSIDIDGGDNEVLRAIDWKRYQPWIVIAEIDSSHFKNLQEQIDLMDQSGYHPFLHIGNVFYIRKDFSGQLFFNWRIQLDGRFGFFLKNG
jgi:FkbM family methyltransferase